MKNNFTIESIKKLQAKPESFEVVCKSCGEKLNITSKHKLKYSPKFYYKMCASCMNPVEGEWKKLLKK